MLIDEDCWVTVRYRLYDSDGEPVEDAERELTYLQGGYGEIFLGIEHALAGHGAGYKASVRLEPHESFGDYDEQLVRLVPRAYREYFPGKDFCADGHFYLHDGTAWCFFRGDLLDQ